MSDVERYLLTAVFAVHVLLGLGCLVLLVAAVRKLWTNRPPQDIESKFDERRAEALRQLDSSPKKLIRTMHGDYKRRER